MDKKYDYSSKESVSNGASEENSENKNGAMVSAESFYHNIAVPEKTDGQDRYYEIFDKDKHKTIIWSVISLVLAVASVACSFLGWIGLAIGVAAIIFSLVSRFNLKYFDTIALMGMIIGIFGLVFGGVFIVWEKVVLPILSSFIMF